jgi:hypothetical protein
MKTIAAIATLLTVAIAGAGYAAVAKSLYYDLEYGAVHAGSASASSASYDVVNTVTSDGVGSQTASAGVYSVSPAVGGTSAPARISDWSLY